MWMEKLALTLGLGDRVRFLGAVPRGELIDHYQKADLLCVPSLSEALSIVTLEGMLCGLPVVGSNTGGISFVVENGVSGYLASPGDVVGLASAIATAASSRTHLAELGESGYRRARSEFGWVDVAEKLESVVGESARYKNERAVDR
jgi:glycosyltransferase involved in cell wall biosynthesis